MPCVKGWFKNKPGYKQVGNWGWDNTKLWSKVEKSQNPNDCWTWLGSVHPAAALFGAWRIFDDENKQQMTQARRLVYMSLTNEDISAYRVMHTCGNPLCVNFNHFELRKTNRPDKQ